MSTDTDRQIFADYYQVYLADPLVDGDWSEAWTAPEALVDRFVTCERILGFVTERNTTVPLRVVSHDAVPDLTDKVLRADHAVKAGLFTSDRRLIIAGCSDYWPEAYSIAVLPGHYGAAFLSFGLATVDGLVGKDRYELHIWPVSEKQKAEVLVRWQPKIVHALLHVCKWHQPDQPRRSHRARCSGRTRNGRITVRTARMTQSVFVPSQTLRQPVGGTASANDARQLAPFMRRAVFMPRSD